MDLPRQKNFYDTKRQFQGKDQPTDTHPAPDSAPPSRGLFVFGVVFFLVLVALFWLREKQARLELEPLTKAATPAASAKH